MIIFLIMKQCQILNLIRAMSNHKKLIRINYLMVFYIYNIIYKNYILKVVIFKEQYLLPSHLSRLCDKLEGGT